jgi:hypothetical protein
MVVYVELLYELVLMDVNKNAGLHFVLVGVFVANTSHNSARKNR